MAQVLIAAPQDIEGDKQRGAAPVKEVVELRPHAAIKAHDLTVEHGILDRHPAPHVFAEVRKRLERISIAGHEYALARFNAGERAKPIVFELEQPFGMIERGNPLPER